MQFSINPLALSQRISTLAKVINAKNALPVLDCIRLEVKGNELTLTASDTENTLTTSLPISDVYGEGTICLDAKNLQNSIKDMKFDAITITTDEHFVTVLDYGLGRMKFVGQDAADYPLTPSVDNDGHESLNTLTLPVTDFAKNLNLCIASTADDELRPQMCGVYFDAAADERTPGKRFTMVSSDGHRLMRIIYNDVECGAGAFIMSKKAAGVLKGIISAQDEVINITVTEHTAQIKTADYTLDCRLIEGRYPNYNSVIPTNNPYRLSVSTPALMSAIRRVMPAASTTSSLLRLDISEGQLKVSAQDLDFNTSAEEKIACQYNASPVAIGFNGNFLSSLLAGLNANEVEISIADASRAALLSPVTDDKEGEAYDYTALLMPMMLE